MTNDQMLPELYPPTLILNLLALEAEWWRFGHQMELAHGVDIDKLANMPFVPLILGLMGFPDPLTEPEADSVFTLFDNDENDLKERFTRLCAEKARIQAARRIASIHQRENTLSPKHANAPDRPCPAQRDHKSALTHENRNQKAENEAEF